MIGARTVAVAVAALVAAGTAAAAPASAAASAFVRVDQVGYPTAATKIGYVLATRNLEGESFRVENAGGSTVLTGTIGADVGPWSQTYDFVGRLDLSALTATGTYHVEIDSPSASSPPFRVDSAPDLYAGLALNA